jgi:uncharacterized protein involved in type VI secretion and phage assembly
MRFDDSKGQQQLFIHAEKDMDVRVKNDQHTVVVSTKGKRPHSKRVRILAIGYWAN